ncbi:MAG: DNA-directed RNA polymerase subunit omega [Bacteroidota bacterium]
MSDIKTKVQGLDPNIRARNVKALAENTGNIYEALAIITRRAKMLSIDLKHELHQKLDEFAVSSDTIEEIHENKEQIEISKFYERLPNPVLIAMNEYTEGELHHRYGREDRDSNRGGDRDRGRY